MTSLPALILLWTLECPTVTGLVGLYSMSIRLHVKATSLWEVQWLGSRPAEALRTCLFSQESGREQLPTSIG